MQLFIVRMVPPPEPSPNLCDAPFETNNHRQFALTIYSYVYEK